MMLDLGVTAWHDERRLRSWETIQLWWEHRAAQGFHIDYIYCPEERQPPAE